MKKIYVLKIVDRVKTLDVSREEFMRGKDVYNGKIEEFAANNDFIEVVNQDLDFLDMRRWSRDGIHPDTVLGKETYAKTIRNVLKRMI